jgi:uncharacterized membrane protein (DUF4010 family)
MIGPIHFPVLDFATALFIGALVGIEREKKLEDEHRAGIGGIRTFILFAESGAVAAWLSNQLGSFWIFIGAGMCVTAVILAGYLAHTRFHEGSFGLTTEIAAFVVFLLGGTTLFQRELAVALAIATSAVLAYKHEMHEMVGKIGREDLYAGLKLLIATFIVLPVLPDKPVDPWLALNPWKIWLLVIFISGLSLVGYVASRWLGTRRGIPLTGLFGGLVSSTAVSLSFAKQSRVDGSRPGLADALAAGLFLSWAVMAVRVLVLMAVVCRPLVVPLVAPMAAMGGIAAVAALVCYRRSAAGATETEVGTPEGGGVPLTNPFSLGSAMKFAALFAVILLFVKIGQKAMPGEGLYAIAALAGLTDVDAIALSMAEYAGGSGGLLAVAATAIVIGALANTAAKCGLVLVLGAGPLRSRTLVVTLLIALGTAAATLLA